MRGNREKYPVSSNRVGGEAEGRDGLELREMPEILAAAIAWSGGESAANRSSMDGVVKPPKLPNVDLSKL